MLEHRSEVIDVQGSTNFSVLIASIKIHSVCGAIGGYLLPSWIEKEKFSLSRSLSEKIAKRALYTSPEPDDETTRPFLKFRAPHNLGRVSSMLAGVMDRCWLRYRALSQHQWHLFDQPHVVRKAPNVFREAHVDQCCTIVGGSFFDEVLTGADAYILKFILHDWNDDQGLRILRHCRQAMSTKAQLLIVERLIGHPMREQKASSPT